MMMHRSGMTQQISWRRRSFYLVCARHNQLHLRYMMGNVRESRRPPIIMQILPNYHMGITAALIAGTVAIHSAGSFFLFWVFRKHRARTSREPGYVKLTLLLTCVVLALLVLHLLEVALWAGFFYRQGCFPDLRTSVYFSLITYATVGYGDVVLTEEWRILGGVEALAGVMMMSWSTAILIGALQWAYSRLLAIWDSQPPKA